MSRTEAAWEMGLAIHRGEVDGVQLVQTSGSLTVTSDIWGDYALLENCRKWVASQNEFVTLDQIEIITFSYVILETDDD